MLWLAAVFSICFLGGWHALGYSSAFILVLKILLVAFGIIKVRANYPRYRYDQLMSLGWKVILPFSIGYFIFVYSLLIFI